MSLSRQGGTRSRLAADHLLHTPESFVYAPLPGMRQATAAVHIAPAAGAEFTQYTAVLERDGSLGPALGSRFVYVLEGAALLQHHGHTTELHTGNYAFVPQGEEHTVQVAISTRLAVIEKPYLPISGAPLPFVLTGHEQDVPSLALNGDDAVQVRALLPAEPAFDFAVNVMIYQPGARLSQVEVHVMEHGLLMLEGEGIYRLGECWYPVTAGDFIWMAPFCPQWFGALGPKPARYLIYKDWNRHPLAAQTRGA